MSLFDKSEEYINFKQNEINNAISYIKSNGIDDNLLQQVRNIIADDATLNIDDIYKFFKEESLENNEAISILENYNNHKRGVFHKGDEEAIPISKSKASKYADDDLIEFYNGTSKTKAERFLSEGLGGTSLENIPIIENGESTILRGEGLQVMLNDSRATFYAKKKAELTDDIPVVIKGKVRAKNLYAANNDYEYGIPRDFYDQLEDVQIFDANTGKQIGAYNKGKKVDFDPNNKMSGKTLNEEEEEFHKKTERKNTKSQETKSDTTSKTTESSTKTKTKYKSSKTFANDNLTKYSQQEIDEFWKYVTFDKNNNAILSANFTYQNGKVDQLNQLLGYKKFTPDANGNIRLYNPETGQVLTHDLKVINIDKETGKIDNVISKGQVVYDSADVTINSDGTINANVITREQNKEFFKKDPFDNSNAIDADFSEIDSEIKSVNIDHVEPKIKVEDETPKTTSKTQTKSDADNVVNKVEEKVEAKQDFSVKKEEIRQRIQDNRRRRYNKEHPDAFNSKSMDAKEILHEEIGKNRKINKIEYKQAQSEVRHNLKNLEKSGKKFVREDISDFAKESVGKIKGKFKLSGKTLGIAAAAAAIVGLTAYGIGKHNKNKQKKLDAQQEKVKNLQSQIDYNAADTNKRTAMSWQQPYMQQAQQQMIDNSNAMQMAKDISSYKYGKKMTGFI